MSYFSYPEYKPARSKLLDEIPAGWQVTQLRHLAQVNNGSDYKEREVADAGYPVIGSGGPFAFVDGYLHDGESVLFGRKGTIDKPRYENGRFWTVDTMFYTVLNSKVVGKFLYYYATVVPFLYYSTSTALPSMTQGDVKSFPVPLPPLAEQKRIADFLDRETAQIDNLIAEQEALVGNLTERRKAVISHAVTKGLDPDVGMKASGSEWTSRIPEHWSVEKFNRVIDINGGQVDPTIEPFASMLMIAPNHIEKFTGQLLLQESASEQGADSGKYIATAGQVIYSKIRPNLCKATIAPADCLCSADTYAMSGRSRVVENRFLLYFLLSKSFTDFSSDASMRVAMPKINRESLSLLRVWLPPIAEQREIVAYLDDQTSKIDTLIVEAKALIDVLKERRSALICAAVTGKIDVRQEALARG